LKTEYSYCQIIKTLRGYIEYLFPGICMVC